MAKKKSRSTSKLRLNKKAKIFFVIIILFAAASFYLFGNGFSASTKCTQTPRVIGDLQLLNINFINKDKQTVPLKDILKGQNLTASYIGKKCKGPGVASTGSSGGCEAYSKAYIMQLKSGDEAKLALYALDNTCGATKYYLGGKLDNTDKPDKPSYLFVQKIEIKSGNKSIGTLTSSSGNPIRYPLSVKGVTGVKDKDDTTAVSVFQKTLNQTVKYSSKTKPLVEKASSSTATTTTTNSNPGEIYTVVVDNINGKVMYDKLSVSKRCTIVARIFDAGGKTFNNLWGNSYCGGTGQADGTYRPITITNIDSKAAKSLYLYASDTGALYDTFVNTVTVDFSKLTSLSLGGNYKNITPTGGGTSLSCRKEKSNIIRCQYTPNLALK